MGVWAPVAICSLKLWLTHSLAETQTPLNDCTADCTAMLSLLQNSASVAVALAQALVLAPAQVSRWCSSCLTTMPFNICAAQVRLQPARSSRLLTQQDPCFTSYHALMY